jgi:hypothetical protein
MHNFGVLSRARAGVLAVLVLVAAGMARSAVAAGETEFRDPMRLERPSREFRREQVGFGRNLAVSMSPASLKDRGHDHDDDDDDEIAEAFVYIFIRIFAEVFTLVEGTDGTHMSLHYGYARERRDRDLILHDFDLRLFKRFSFSGDNLSKGDNWAWGGFGLRFGGHSSSDESRGANDERLARVHVTVPIGFGYVHEWQKSPWLGSMGAAEVYGEFGLTGGTAINLSATPAPAGARAHTGSTGLRVGASGSMGYSVVTAYGSITIEEYPGGTFYDRVWGVKLGPPLVNVLCLSLGQRQVEYLGVEKTFEFVALTLSFRF